MSNATRLVGAVCVLVVALLGVRLGLSVGWAVVAAVLASAAVWSAAAWAASKGGGEHLRTQTFEMAVVSLVGAGILPFVGLGRLLHGQFGASLAASVWTSIGAAVAALIAGMVVYYKIDNRPAKPVPRRAPAAAQAPDFTVRVEGDGAAHLRDVVTVVLNEHVPVVFVPDVDPPSRPDTIPGRQDVAGQYVITANDHLAGTFGHPGPTVLFYVTSAEFAHYVTELRTIRALRPAGAGPRRASELGGYRVIDLLRRVASA